MIINEPINLPILKGANLKLFSFRASHSLTQFTVEKEGQDKLMLNFSGTKYLQIPIELNEVSISLLNEKIKDDSVISSVLSDNVNAQCFVINSSEGEFYIIAEVTSIEKFENKNEWFEKSLNHKLTIGFPSPIDIKEIKEIVEKNFYT